MKLDTLFLSANGRMDRRQYWIGAPIILALIALQTILFIAFGPVFYSKMRIFNNIFDFISVVMIYPGVCLYSKRLHDVGLSGWLQLIIYIPTLCISAYALAIVAPEAARVVAEHPHDRTAQKAASKAFTPPPGVQDWGYAGDAISVFLVAGLGLIPGQARDNKYGPQPKPAPAPALS